MRELNDIHRGGDGDMGQMRFGQAKVARAPQAHRARPLRMRSFNACPMAIGVLEGLRALSLACSKKRLHPLWWPASVRVRRVELVQEARLEHALQSVWENFTLMTGLPLAS